ncbi:sensor histidine kinase [Amycolatopsis suaedae]|uniref:histidine kinase n=1 Tax=Amycolatopsis suaedae TaxID=2510978 RepID=A0A4Q7JGA6_9PSEU|nr:histidine kinase [Amycolatopsis suaedae]RZQ66073.1 sensor histidine kinase [Amycolatopsis suaedae]
MNNTATRRSAREWFVDFVLFVLAAFFGLFVVGLRHDEPLPIDPLFWAAEQLLSLLACLALLLRRRWPVQVAVAIVGLSALFEMVGGALLVALFSVAVYRPPRISVPIFALSLVAGLILVLHRTEPDWPFLAQWLFGSSLQAAATASGLTVHHRRELMISLRDRAVRAETEAMLRAEHGQHLAREAIAREIHDVLGHRLSLLSVHAGALTYRPDAPAEDISRAAEIIRDSAHRALQDLREVVGVLRAPVGELPQPTFDDLPKLISESAEAGMRVELDREVDGEVPETAGRTAFRIVQEALTNARKHAPDAKVTVRLAGEPGEGLSVEVVNASPDEPGPPSSTPGQGLAGLTERVTLTGGRLDHGGLPDGGWRVAAWLPWRS